jgi:hypothetical protein
MTRSRTLENRRQEPRRQYLPRAPVAWRRHGSAMWHRGWLNDASPSGASMLVPAESQPHAGQDIDLRRRDSGQALLCRVVRTQIQEHDQGLVGCRVVSAEGCPALLRAVPHAGTARRKAVRRESPLGLCTYSPHDVPRRRSA